MNLSRSKTQFLAVCVALLVVCAIAGYAQSGRKQPKAPPAAPVPTPTPEPTPEPKKNDKKSELGFIIAANRYTSIDSYPFTYFDAVMAGCAGRLRSGSSATVTVAQDDMNRGAAIKKAKAETTTTYIVLFELKLDYMARSYDDLVAEFTVFAPQTAKVVVFGTAYQNVNRRGPVVVGPNSRGSSGGLRREQLLKYVGEDAGDRILKALNLNVPILH
jgi:hypothetical protein